MTLRFGDRVGNGARVLVHTQITYGGNGMLPEGIVLAYWQADKSFVVWRTFEQEGQWVTENGHYFRDDFEKALAHYLDKGGEFETNIV